jgi:hypothetical protein
MAVNESFRRRTFDRRLFAIAALLFPIIILAGFARTYYLRSFFISFPLGSNLVRLHGILMTTWVALFVSQVWLISSKRIRVHQRLGLASVGLAVLIIVVGFFTAVRAAKFGSSASPPEIPSLSFLIVPLTDMLMFGLLFGAAIYFRNRPAEHKRLMLLMAINFLPPAVARISVSSLQSLGPLWFFGLPAVLALTAFALDSWRNRKVNKAFLAGMLLLILSFVVRLAVMGTNAWVGFAKWLTTWAA